MFYEIVVTSMQKLNVVKVLLRLTTIPQLVKAVSQYSPKAKILDGNLSEETQVMVSRYHKYLVLISCEMMQSLLRFISQRHSKGFVVQQFLGSCVPREVAFAPLTKRWENLVTSFVKLYFRII